MTSEMNDTRGRLIRCFAAVFPEVAEQELPRASSTTLSAWDSLASITLLTVLEEEFGLQIDAEQLEGLQSFEAVFDYVSRQHQAL
jgi:acyl carrier protein